MLGKLTRQFAAARAVLALPRSGRSEDGTILLAIIAIFSLTATLGAAMLTTNRTSAWAESVAGNQAKANYLAEAGARHALPLIQELLATKGDPNSLGYNMQRHTLANQDGSFLLTLTPDDPHNPGKYTLTSTGTLANGAASKTIHYDIPVPATIIGFNTVGPFFFADRSRNSSGDSLIPDDWNVVGDAQVISDPLPNDEEHVFLLLATGERNAMNGGDTTASAAWANTWSSMPLFNELWEANDNLLGYAIQVKISLEENHDLLAGISFRLTSQDESASGHATFYGISYLYNSSAEERLPIFSPDPAFAADSAYLILWKQEADGRKTVLHRKQLLETDGVVQTKNGRLTLQPMTTLVVNIAEQYRRNANGAYLDVHGQPTNNPETYSRENLITVAMQNSADYPPGELTWDFSRFRIVTWSDANLASCSEENPGACLLEASFTSAAFAAREPDEIGLHAYGNGAASLSDYAVLFSSSAPIVQYY